MKGKKLIMVLLCLVFVLSSVFVLVGCASKGEEVSVDGWGKVFVDSNIKNLTYVQKVEFTDASRGVAISTFKRDGYKIYYKEEYDGEIKERYLEFDNAKGTAYEYTYDKENKKWTKKESPWFTSSFDSDAFINALYREYALSNERLTFDDKTKTHKGLTTYAVRENGLTGMDRVPIEIKVVDGKLNMVKMIYSGINETTCTYSNYDSTKVNLPKV